MSSHTHIHHSLHQGLRKVAVALLVFALVLLSLLWISLSFLLPRLATVQVDEQLLSMEGLKEYHSDLRASLVDVETKRTGLLQPVADDVFNDLIAQKSAQWSLESLESELQHAIADTEDRGGRVVLSSVHYIVPENALVLRGDVRDAGVSTMTVLADFVQNLQHLPVVDRASQERYTRLHDETIGHYSPFAISLTLSTIQ